MSPLLLSLLGFAFAHAGGMLGSEPVSLRGSEKIAHWVGNLERMPGGIECRPAAELPGAVLCAASSLKQMNSVFARISMYAEGIYGSRRGEVPELGAKAHLTAMDFAGGHDLRGDTIAAFFAEVERQCPKNPKTCLSPQEEAMRTQVALPLQALSQN
jgi:hypothetical protein